MKTRYKILGAFGLLKAIILRKKIPLVVGLALTNRCNRKCMYCKIENTERKELDTNSILSIIDQFSRLGGQIVSLTGGEPLLRDDIGVIVDYLAKKNMLVRLNSNGSLFPQKLNELKRLDEIKLSLDGTEENHDRVRGANSYSEVMKAARLAKDNNIGVAFNTVLSKYNLNDIDFVLDIARMFDAKVTFQPATQFLLGSNDVNHIAPEEKEYKEAINKLIIRKKKNKHVHSSMSCLKHLYNWPQPREMHCSSRLITCWVRGDGEILNCSDHRRHFKGTKIGVNCLVFDFKTAFNKLPDVSCNNCWCADRIEANCLVSLKVDALLNAIRL